MLATLALKRPYLRLSSYEKDKEEHFKTVEGIVAKACGVQAEWGITNTPSVIYAGIGLNKAPTKSGIEELVKALIGNSFRDVEITASYTNLPKEAYDNHGLPPQKIRYLRL